MADTTRFPRDVAIVGGAGHIGLPLALALADRGLRTVIYDINTQALEQILRGRMPFREEGAEEVLGRVLRSGTLAMEDRPDLVRECRFIVLVVGTPVDEHLNPTFSAMHRAIDGCAGVLRDGQILILRSTVFPGIGRHLQAYLRERGLAVDVAVCPERVAEGHSLREFCELPQIISAFDPEVLAQVRWLFGHLASEFIELSPMEAELAKLMTNNWRYIQFAIVNQFYMIADRQGLDFSRILHACRHNYPRMVGMPGPGLAAGPCLVKDTMQLAAFSQNHFVLGHAAMLVNEGLPYYLVEKAKLQANLAESTVGILGMAFKAESDDPRDSLSYKLRKLLALEARTVLCSDPYVQDPTLVPLERVLREADVIFVGVPHRVYRALACDPGRLWIDVWSCVGSEAR